MSEERATAFKEPVVPNWLRKLGGVTVLEITVPTLNTGATCSFVIGESEKVHTITVPCPTWGCARLARGYYFLWAKLSWYLLCLKQ